jgi:hypothetical protein
MKLVRVVAAAVIVAAPFAMIGDRDPARLRLGADLTPGTTQGHALVLPPTGPHE